MPVLETEIWGSMSKEKLIGSYIADNTAPGANWLAYFPTSPPLNVLKTGMDTANANSLGLVV